MQTNGRFSVNVKLAVEQIRSADRIMIVCHANPDGDTIGSLLALGLGLLSIDKKVVMVSPDGIPARYQFLPGSELVLEKVRGSVDLGIAVDCGSAQQLGRLGKSFQKIKKTIQVDHHDCAENFCSLLVADPNAAAVGEIIYDILRHLKIKVTPAVATCLLTSIIVDTGSFRFSNIRSRTFRICADLLDKGVDLKYLIEEAYWKKTESTVRLEAVCVNNMMFEQNGKVVWSVIYQTDVKKIGGMLADGDGVADDLRSIEGVKAAVLFRETEDGKCRVSMRSTAGVNVAKVAEHFGGGGHKNSAGFHIPFSKSNMNKVVKILCSLVM